jgi:hypothetical protein
MSAAAPFVFDLIELDGEDFWPLRHGRPGCLRRGLNEDTDTEGAAVVPARLQAWMRPTSTRANKPQNDDSSIVRPDRLARGSGLTLALQHCHSARWRDRKRPPERGDAGERI